MTRRGKSIRARMMRPVQGKRKEGFAGRDVALLKKQNGFTLAELLITLSIVSLLTLTLVSIDFDASQKIREIEFEAECDKVLQTVLQCKNDAMMDGVPREIQFFEGSMMIGYTKDGKNNRKVIPINTLRFANNFTGAQSLWLNESGTVSKGGTLYLISHWGKQKNLVVQLGNGRIYLNAL